MKVAKNISLTEEERTVLNVWLRLHTSARLVLRVKIILLAAEGKTNMEIAGQLHTTRKRVSLWRRRFLERRLAGIETEAPRGRQGSEALLKMVRQKMKQRPANGTRWTIRLLAKELGISASTVQRVWKASKLTCHQE